MNFDKEPELPDLPPGSARPRRWIWLLGVLGLGAAGFLAWWQLASPAALRQARPGKNAAEIAALEGRLGVIARSLAELEPGGPVEARRKLLEEAVEQQDRLRRLRHVPVRQDEVSLAQWQALLGDIHAREWSAQSEELVAEAARLERQHQPGAVDKLKEALRLQRQVNGGLADQSLKNYAREAWLVQETGRLEAEPLQAEEQRLLGEARAGAAAGRWAEALELFGRARDIRQRLNREYARTRFADLLEVDRLDAEMASLGAGAAHDQLETLLVQARAATQGPDETDRLLAEAAGKQKFINEQFPKSRFASMERLQQIEAERQNLRADPELAEVQALERQAAQHLRRREPYQAQQALGAALEKIGTLVTPQSAARGMDEELRRRLGYLKLRSADLGQIQDQTYDLLRPLSGHEQSALLRTEVPQALFALVMSTNPSRNPGRTLPVDSTTQAEAEEFCRRLGWVLGATVRLPTADELRAAVNDAAFNDPARGFTLWLAAPSGGPTAPVLGTDGVVKEAPRAERSRSTSFRVVVEVDLLAGR